MQKVLWGFLPWIVYFILIGASQERIDLAIIAALICLLLVNFNELRKGFILPWGTIIFFVFMLFAIVFYKNQWVIIHKWILSNAILASIAWYSILINKPFTIQYAKEQVDASRWEHPTFKKINLILTLVWAVIFTICLVVHIMQLYYPLKYAKIYWVITNGLSLLGIFFTVKFPEFYRNKKRGKNGNES